MLDITEFKRRLAAGEFDDTIHRLMNESDALDESEVSDEAITPEVSFVLDRGRLLRRSTLQRLYVSGVAGSIASPNGPHTLHLKLLNDQSAAAKFTLTIPDVGTAHLTGDFPTGWQLLDLVVVVPAVKRNGFVRKVTIDSTIVAPRTERPQSNRSIPATTVLSTPTLGEGGTEAKSLPSFEVSFDSVETGFRLSTPAQALDGQELLVLVTIESESPVAVIMERLEANNPQLTGWCELPGNLRAANRIKVRIAPIDLDHLDDLPPAHASLWLATQPMIAMPLKKTSDGYEFTMYDTDRDFLLKHPDSVLACRVASQVSEVA